MELVFFEEMNKLSVEETIASNIVKNSITSIPEIKYEWKSGKNLLLTLNELGKGNTYKIDLTGAKDIENNVILGLYDSNKVDVGGMFNTENIIYEFNICDYDFLAFYRFDNEEVEKITNLANELYSSGNLSEDNRWLLLGIGDEWLYHMSIFVKNKKNYFIGEEVSVLSYEDAYVDNKYAVFLMSYAR